MADRPCCAIGARSDAAEIDAALRAGTGLGTVCKAHPGLVRGTLGRHRQRCLGMVMTETQETSPETPPAQEETPAETAADPQETPVSPTGSVFSVTNPRDDPMTAPRRLITAEVERRCVDLRVKGRSYEDIAAEVGVHPDTAMDAVERVLLRTRGKADAQADRAREIELRRCDAIIASFWERATAPAMATVEVPANTESGVRDYDGQDKAADRLLKAMERRAKLLGLDAPTGPVVNIFQVPGVQDLTRALGSVVPALVKLAAAGHGEDAVLALHRRWLQALADGDVSAIRDPAAWVLDQARVVDAPALPEGGSR